MMKEMRNGVYTYNDETYSFNFVTNLSASDKAIFVRTVVDTIVDNDSYDSVLRDIIFDYTIISMFTDVDTSLFKVEDNDNSIVTDIDLIEEFLLDTNIVEIVRANAFPTLFEQLEKAVDKSIEYRTGIHPSPISDALSSLLSTIEKKIEGIDSNALMGMAQKFAGMTDELTPESIMNAYMNSDFHKNNVIEIEESKKNRTEIAKNLDKAIKEVNAEAKASAKSNKKK